MCENKTTKRGFHLSVHDISHHSIRLLTCYTESMESSQKCHKQLSSCPQMTAQASVIWVFWVVEQKFQRTTVDQTKKTKTFFVFAVMKEQRSRFCCLYRLWEFIYAAILYWHYKSLHILFTTALHAEIHTHTSPCMQNPSQITKLLLLFQPNIKGPVCTEIK